MQLGQQIDILVKISTDKTSLMMRLSRDISKARGKVISSNKLEAYQQLFLRFDSTENLIQETKELRTDVSVDLLLEMVEVNVQSGKNAKCKNDKNNVIYLLEKIKKLLVDVEVLIELKPLDNSNKEIAELKFRDVHHKFNALNDLICSGAGRKQQNLFPEK
jgi:hypothetical protein